MIYAITGIWLISNILGIYLSKRVSYKPGVVARFVGALLGPFALPLIFFLKPDRPGEAQ